MDVVMSILLPLKSINHGSFCSSGACATTARKICSAQESGFNAALIFNNTGDNDRIFMQKYRSKDIKIPFFFIGYDDGARLNGFILASHAVEKELYLSFDVCERNQGE